jgi:hypothetical protein
MSSGHPSEFLIEVGVCNRSFGVSIHKWSGGWGLVEWSNGLDVRLADLLGLGCGERRDQKTSDGDRQSLRTIGVEQGPLELLKKKLHDRR